MNTHTHKNIPLNIVFIKPKNLGKYYIFIIFSNQKRKNNKRREKKFNKKIINCNFLHLPINTNEIIP